MSDTPSFVLECKGYITGNCVTYTPSAFQVDATTFLMARSSAKMELHQEPQWREKTIKHLVEILSAYRVNVGSPSFF